MYNQPRSQSLAYICGFEGNKMLRLQYEYIWKSRRDHERSMGMNSVKQIARLASGIIPSTEGQFGIQLTLVLNFED